MTGRLKGKVALVIGAGSVGPGWGNGKATAVAYGREGATVVCVDKNADAAAETAALVEGEGARSLALCGDVCREDDVRRIVSDTLEHYGAIDVLHNNVGLALLGGPVDISLQDWSRSLDLNIGYMLLTVLSATRQPRRPSTSSPRRSRSSTPARAFGRMPSCRA